MLLHINCPLSSFYSYNSCAFLFQHYWVTILLNANISYWRKLHAIGNLTSHWQGRKCCNVSRRFCYDHLCNVLCELNEIRVLWNEISLAICLEKNALVALNHSNYKSCNKDFKTLLPMIELVGLVEMYYRGLHRRTFGSNARSDFGSFVS